MHYFSSQRGFSLIEVLVAVLIVAIGLVGVAGMQFIGLKGNQQSFSKNQAAHHAQSLLERMRSNPVGVSNGNYVLDSATLNCNQDPVVDCGLSASSCSSQEMASYDLFSAYCGNNGNFFSGMKGGLSNARLNISCPAACQDGLTLSLGWDEQQLGDENNSSTSVARELLINTVVK